MSSTILSDGSRDRLSGRPSRRTVVCFAREQIMAHPPNGSLRAVMYADLTKDRLDVNLHSSLSNGVVACDHLVGITCNQSAQDG